ncbi:GNAT family N-acetyltransferase [Aureimonas sp. ME7]|uniref:GNAT family N-acetyltransferase n=1 Tax=Aureimonas sp. ME7 TaxID=2744252 RepID=UPI0015F47A4B|nr:GNAT family N-acetyltransferase [Aureimonas sp. ME7]
MPRPAAVPSDPFVIRGAEPGDADGIAALCNLPAFRFGTLRLPFETGDKVRRRLFEGRSDLTLLVAEIGPQIVGTASLHRDAGRRAHVGAIGMGVHDDFHRRGIGRALLCALLDLADDWLGLLRLELDVQVDNDPAVSLYRSAGFEIEGRARQSTLRAGAYVDCFIMARLRPVPTTPSSTPPLAP